MTFQLSIAENSMKKVLKKLKKREDLKICAVLDMLNVVIVDCSKELIFHVVEEIPEIEHVERESRKRAI